jgi:hypothetical protein
MSSENNSIVETLEQLTEVVPRTYEVSYKLESNDAVRIIIGDKEHGGITETTLESMLAYLREHRIAPYWIGVANARQLKIEAFWV